MNCIICEICLNEAKKILRVNPLLQKKNLGNNFERLIVLLKNLLGNILSSHNNSVNIYTCKNHERTHFNLK